MQRSQFRVLKTVGAVVLAAAIAPTLAVAQSQDSAAAGAKVNVGVTDSAKASDTTKAKAAAGTQVIQLTPQGGSAKPGQGMVIEMQGPGGQKMSGVIQIQMGGQGMQPQGGQAPAGGQPQIKTEAATDTTGKAPAADSTKAPSR